MLVCAVWRVVMRRGVVAASELLGESGRWCARRFHPNISCVDLTLAAVALAAQCNVFAKKPAATAISCTCTCTRCTPHRGFSCTPLVDLGVAVATKMRARSDYAGWYASMFLGCCASHSFRVLLLLNQIADEMRRRSLDTLYVVLDADGCGAKRNSLGFVVER